MAEWQYINEVYKWQKQLDPPVKAQPTISPLHIFTNAALCSVGGCTCHVQKITHPAMELKLSYRSIWAYLCTWCLTYTYVSECMVFV